MFFDVDVNVFVGWLVGVTCGIVMGLILALIIGGILSNSKHSKQREPVKSVFIRCKQHEMQRGARWN